MQFGSNSSASGWRTRLRRVGALATVLLCMTAGVSAAATYDVPRSAGFSYHYNIYGEAVPAPDFYTYAVSLGDGLSNPADLFLLGGELYIMDSGNGRVAVLSAETGALLREIRPKADPDGSALSLTDARGIFVSADGLLYVCLYDQKMIAVLQPDGTVLQRLGQPQSPLLPNDFTYYPQRVAVQTDGRLYVVSEGTYQGMIQLTGEGEFVSFFGSNQVEVTPAAVLNLMWRKLFNQEQGSRLANTLPVDYSSVTLGPDGFLYSTTANETTKELKKHGPDGSNILSYQTVAAPGVLLGGEDYGDLETFRDGETIVDTRFSDISVSPGGILYALDTNRSRIFAYDQQSNLLGIFGAAADQSAGFKTPVAIEADDKAVYVLDQGRGEVLRFLPTEYADALIKAAVLHGDGLFSQAKPYWEAVRKANSNLALCAAGLGWSSLEAGEYAQAMDYFREARDVTGYNQAYLAMRNSLLSDWALLIFGVAAAAIAGLFVLIGIKSKKGAFNVNASGRRLTPTQVMFHPSVGFDAMKDERLGSNRWAIATVFALFAVRMLSIRYTGFLFNPYRVDTINMLVEFVQIIAIFAAWVICCWAVGTLVDSEARIGEIFRASAYALCPYIICQALSILISNVLVLREGAFVSGLSMIGLYWSALWMVVSVMKTHKFTLGKTVLFLLLVLLCIFFLLFLCVMFYSLAGQFGSFLSTIYDEILFRL